jgi:hypothetical protein
MSYKVDAGGCVALHPVILVINQYGRCLNYHLETSTGEEMEVYIIKQVSRFSWKR